jgi:hypothetical protein
MTRVMRALRENGLHYTPSGHGATSNCQALFSFNTSGNRSGVCFTKLRLISLPPSLPFTWLHCIVKRLNSKEAMSTDDIKNLNALTTNTRGLTQQHSPYPKEA